MSTLLHWHWTSSSATFLDIVLDGTQHSLHKDDYEQFFSHQFTHWEVKGHLVGVKIRATPYWLGLPNCLEPIVYFPESAVIMLWSFLTLWTTSMPDETGAWLSSYLAQLEEFENWAHISLFEIWWTGHGDSREAKKMERVGVSCGWSGIRC